MHIDFLRFQEDRGLNSRLRDALRMLGCEGRPVLSGIKPDSAVKFSTASGAYVVGFDDLQIIGWDCTKPVEVCKRCPRFQAYRQGHSANGHELADLQVSRNLVQIEPKVFDGDRKPAEIAHGDEKTRLSVTQFCADNEHFNFDPVVHPVAPCVHHAEHCTQQGKCRGHDLNGVVVQHVSSPPCRNATGPLQPEPESKDTPLRQKVLQELAAEQDSLRLELSIYTFALQRDLQELRKLPDEVGLDEDGYGKGIALLRRIQEREQHLANGYLRLRELAKLTGIN